MAKWEPHPKVRPLLAAIASAERRRDERHRQEQERQRLLKTALFPSLLPGSRGAMSPLGGQAVEIKPQTKQRGK
jgi:hypothetical protein